MTPKQRRRRVLRSVEDFYKHCQLADVVYTDVHVWQPDDDEVEPGSANLNAGFQMTDDDETLVVNIRVLIRTQGWSYQVAVATLYTGKTPFRVEPDMMGDVMNTSTLVTAVPFLRAGVLDLATRVRDMPPPVLPLAGPATGVYLTLSED